MFPWVLESVKLCLKEETIRLSLNLLEFVQRSAATLIHCQTTDMDQWHCRMFYPESWYWCRCSSTCNVFDNLNLVPSALPDGACASVSRCPRFGFWDATSSLSNSSFCSWALFVVWQYTPILGEHCHQGVLLLPHEHRWSGVSVIHFECIFNVAANLYFMQQQKSEGSIDI